MTYLPKGQDMLYLRLSKVVSEVLRAALPFYKRSRSDREDTGFEVNPHDPCGTNKIVKRHQMTVCWHVDDLKVSHKEENEATELAVKFGGLYGSKTTIYHAKVHAYLGMDIDWATKPGTMTVSMVKCLYKVTEEFPDVIKVTRSSPIGDHLLNMWEDAN